MMGKETKEKNYQSKRNEAKGKAYDSIREAMEDGEEVFSLEFRKGRFIVDRPQKNIIDGTCGGNVEVYLFN